MRRSTALSSPEQVYYYWFEPTGLSQNGYGPGRVDFRAPDEGFGLDGTPKPEIQTDPSPQKGEGPFPSKRKPCMHDMIALRRKETLREPEDVHDRDSMHHKL